MEQNFFVNTSVLLIFFILARTFFSSSIKPYQESLEALKYMASLSLSSGYRTKESNPSSSNTFRSLCYATWFGR